MHYFIRILQGLIFALAGVLHAYSAGGSVNLPQAPIEYGNLESTQRGAAIFVNYCMGCHSAEYMRYGRMAEDVGISEAQIQEFLIHNAASLGDGMKSAMRTEDGKEWFHQATPPDLSLSARLRNPDWLYAYMRSFYRDSSRPSGWNNTLFDNVAMPHVLSDLQGVYTLDEDSGKLTQTTAGRLSPEEYDAAIVDLVNFMAYIAEPSRATRLKTGYLVMAFLLTLLLATYFLYREYWRDIK
ncbi:MAG: cytochrome c1 [Gammaproteobacteria bacterium WSBS_2016_MAG_OTU1]